MMAKLSLKLLSLISSKRNVVYEGKDALTEFEDGVSYVIETSEGITTGIWLEDRKAFWMGDPEGFCVFKEPSFLNPKSDLVAWEKAS